MFPGSKQQCEQFSAGLLRRGLSAAVATYINKIDTLSQKRMQARLYINQGDARTGLGILLPTAGYNFSDFFLLTPPPPPPPRARAHLALTFFSLCKTLTSL